MKASWLRRSICFAAAFAGLAAMHRPMLHSAPTPDQILGIWTEGAYLAETNFDYARLFWEEPPASKGGPRTYMISILPTITGGLLAAFDDPRQAIFAYHLFAVGCAALALVCLFELLLPSAGTAGAALTTAAAATTPLFRVQVELAGMEMPLTACTMLAASLAAKDRFVASAGAATAAFFVKSNGLVLLAANLLCVLCRWRWLRDAEAAAPTSSALRRAAFVNIALLVLLGTAHAALVLK